MERRIRRLGIVLLVCFAALFVQLNNIQVLKASGLANSPNNPRIQDIARSQPRGDILSSNGVVLASSVPSTGYYKYQRTYNPATATLFSQIVGYDTIFGTRTGVEAEYNSFLQSHTRPARTLRDLLINRTTTDNVTLTINSQLQLEVAGVVEGINQNGSAPSAAATVINVKTGAIEAMYGRPTFNPQPLASQNTAVVNYAYAALNPNSGSSPLVSRAYQRGYAPGSTFKTVTSSAVYDHQPALAKVDYPVARCVPLPQSNLPVCNYSIAPGVHEACGGTILVTLPESCDIAFAQMGMALGGPALTAEAQAFGFNQRIPIDLPDVAVSSFPSGPSFDANKPSQAYSAFGQQNVVATTLQMVLVTAGIANQGVIMTPHVMQEIRDSQGNLVETYRPHPWLTATTPFTASAVTSLMQGVVTQPGGTAYGVFPPQWNVAAKTGTAETGPNAALTNDWMVAFAPANDPKVAVAVVVPNQPGSATGAATSGPPTKAILGYALAATP